MRPGVILGALRAHVVRRGSWHATLLVAALMAALAAPGGADAQQRARERRGPADRAQLEQRIRAQMGLMMQRRLDLDAEQSERLAQVVQDFESRRRELFREEQETRREVEAFLDASGDDQAQASALLGRMAELRLREAELFRQEQEALLEVLTPAQLLELQELRQELGRRIRALRGGGRGDDARRGGRGPGAFRLGPDAGDRLVPGVLAPRGSGRAL